MNALVIGLLSGLGGGVLGATTGIIAVLLRAETEVDREVREARRQHRREQAQALHEFLKEVARYHGSIFLRRQMDSQVEGIRPFAEALGVTDEQLAAFHTEQKAERSPLPNWIEVISSHMGAILVLEDFELRNHLQILAMEMVSPKPAGWLRPDQVTAVVWQSRLLLERYVSVVPVRRRPLIQRLRIALGIGVPEWDNVPEHDPNSLAKLIEQVKAMEAPSAEG